MARENGKETDARIAVLIDSDNVSPKYINAILTEVSAYGIATYKRIYGDWTKTNTSRWKEQALEQSIIPIQQYSYTVGKNATDSAMIIDAMDILYSHTVEGFCLVSSDSDFTRLAARLREAGMTVIGMGESKTPKPFRSACNAFKILDILVEEKNQETTETSGSKRRKGNTHNVDAALEQNEDVEVTKLTEIEDAILKIIDENSNKGKETDIGEVGSKLNNLYSDFDIRNYGYKRFSTFLEEAFEGFMLRKEDNRITVRQKKSALSKKEIETMIIEIIGQHQGVINNMSILDREIKKHYPGFSVKNYGYSKLSSFIKNCKSIEVNNNQVRICK